MKIKSIAVAAAVMLTVGSIAEATPVSINFAQEGADMERGLANGAVLNNANTGGIPITFSATGGFAYFDGLSSGRPAGLGVCGALTSAQQCNPSSDDNITTGEAVTISFNGLYSLSNLTFRDANHFPLSSANTLLINNIEFTFAAAILAVLGPATSFTFAFGGSNPAQFYLSTAQASVVPVPGAFMLLPFGLAALGYSSRRRQSS